MTDLLRLQASGPVIADEQLVEEENAEQQLECSLPFEESSRAKDEPYFLDGNAELILGRQEDAGNAARKEESRDGRSSARKPRKAGFKPKMRQPSSARTAKHR